MESSAGGVGGGGGLDWAPEAGATEAAAEVGNPRWVAARVVAARVAAEPRKWRRLMAECGMEILLGAAVCVRGGPE